MSTLTEVLTKLETAVSNLITLKITTTVGDKTIQTVINLVGGDIAMTIDPSFVEPEQKAILDLHLEREKQGAQIVKDNIAALEKLAQLIPEIKKALG